MGVAAHRSPQGWGRSQRLGLRAAGAGLLAATAAIHLYLYLTGYRTIPTIGWLFLVQVIPAFLLTAALPVSRSRIVAGRRAGSAWRPRRIPPVGAGGPVRLHRGPYHRGDHSLNHRGHVRWR